MLRKSPEKGNTSMLSHLPLDQLFDPIFLLNLLRATFLPSTGL